MRTLTILTLLVTLCSAGNYGNYGSSNYGSKAYTSKQYVPVPHFLPYRFPNVQHRAQAPIIVRRGGSSFNGLAGKYNVEYYVNIVTYSLKTRFYYGFEHLCKKNSVSDITHLKEDYHISVTCI